MRFKIGYARVSTDEQNLDGQIDQLRAAGCDKVYSDKASGGKTERPGLTGALDALREGDVLVVYSLSRLGRSLPHLVKTVCDLEERGVGFQSLTEGLDTKTAQGKLVFSIFCGLAEFERELIRERTKNGLASARARGRMGGRPKKLTDKQVAQARQLLLDPKQTVTEVAKTFHVSKPTLYRALRDGDVKADATKSGA